MPGLESALGEDLPQRAVREELDENELQLFRAMRDRVADGAQVKFKEDHEGELIAIESVLHRASDFE